MLSDEDNHILARWRLVLGKDAEAFKISCKNDGACSQVEQLVSYLFSEEGTANGAPGTGPDAPSGQHRTNDRLGGSGDSVLSIPEWVEKVRELFPNQAKEILEKELVRRRGIEELLREPKLLERIEANVDLVKTILSHRHLLKPETRVLARKIIDQVVEQLKQKMRFSVENAIVGALRRDRHSPRRVYRNLDVKTTLRRNLVNYDVSSKKVFVDRLFFFAAERKKKPWHIIVTVDQSGSMLESAIFSAIMASIFAELPALKTSLVLFDTQIVDLSARVGQPVDVLLSVNLGGGTDITKALQYSNQLVRQPSRTIVVLITDFYEGRADSDLIGQTRLMADSGIRMIGLGALGYNARPDYNKELAKKLRKVGMDILICTPEKLAECMGKIIRG